MKILLDECLPLDFRHCFVSHQAHTAQWAGFKGKQNGELIRAAESAGYEIPLTVDQGIPHQQPPAGRQISIIVIRSPTNQLEDLEPLVASILRAIGVIQPAQTLVIPAPDADEQSTPGSP